MAITLVAWLQLSMQKTNISLPTTNVMMDSMGMLKTQKQQWWSPEPPISSKTMWQVVWPNPAFPRLVWVNTPASMLALAIIRTF
jgi:hypothetical protein